MSRMPMKSIHFEYGTCDFCGAEDVEISPLSEITTPTTTEDEKWICADCIEEEYPDLQEDSNV